MNKQNPPQGFLFTLGRLVWMLLMLHAGGCTLLPPADRAATSEARHTYVMAGQGSPTVILESGLGDGKDSWVPVFTKVAKQATVFAYDRAGYGASRSTNTSRDGATIVRELRATLQHLNLRPPYILVGHSVGGTYMELYARTHPQEVAGVVLVDARHADFTRQCRQAEARACTPPALISALLPRTPKQELADGDKTMAQVMRAGPFPDVPLAVLTSSKKFLEGAAFRQVWMDTQRQLVALSTQSTHSVCKTCGHYIHKDDPKLVVEAIRSVAERSRAAM